MFSIAHPEYRPLTIFLIWALILFKILVARFFLTHYIVPETAIHHGKKTLRSLLQLIVVTIVAILPLQLQRHNHLPAISIVLDDSLSMSSSDASPNRLQTAQTLISNIVNAIKPKECYSLQAKVDPSCPQDSILQKSGSSITDLVLLAYNQHPQHILLVLSDGGANNGISINQLQQYNTGTIVWVDIQANPAQLLISWNSIQTQKLYNALSIGNYFQLENTDPDSINELSETLKKLLLQQSWSRSISINYILIGILLWMGAQFSFLHFMQTTQRNRKIS